LRSAAKRFEITFDIWMQEQTTVIPTNETREALEDINKISGGSTTGLMKSKLIQFLR
jgi:hypothetical protein